MIAKNGLKGFNLKGFTLLELMIVVMVVAVLVALAYPSYSQYVRKSKRGEAQQMLMNWSVNQEIYRSSNPTYDDGTDLAPPDHADYEMTVSGADAAGYTLTATAEGDQVNDAEDGQSCSTLTLNASGAKGPMACWGGRS